MLDELCAARLTASDSHDHANGISHCLFHCVSDCLCHCLFNCASNRFPRSVSHTFIYG